jgi:hypothetical protein
MFHENISNLPRIIFLQAGNFFIDHSRVYPKYFEELKKRLYELNPSYNSHNSEILFEETTQSITLRKKLELSLTRSNSEKIDLTPEETLEEKLSQKKEVHQLFVICTNFSQGFQNATTRRYHNLDFKEITKKALLSKEINLPFILCEEGFYPIHPKYFLKLSTLLSNPSLPVYLGDTNHK